MDGDRPVADGRDIFESKLQNLVRDALFYGRFNPNKSPGEFEPAFDRYDEKIHELLISYLDGETGDVGTQDETSEAREVGDDVRSETDMRFSGFKPTVFDDITDDFTKKLSMRSPHGGAIKPIGHCKLEKNPDGSIRATIEYF